MEAAWFTLHKAVFLDRDGLINQKAPEHDYIKSEQGFLLLPGVSEAIRALNQAGYLVLVVTNQRGIARGLMTMEDLERIHWHMRRELARAGAYIDQIYVCPHDVGQCNCRKPDIGLFIQASYDFAIDRAHSWMVGDSDSDVEAGNRFGLRTVKTTCLTDAVKKILEEM